MGNPVDEHGAGNFDLKFTDLYIAHFETNIKANGTSLSGNGNNNTTILDSYVSGGLTNLDLTYTQGFIMIGSQLESHYQYGVNLTHCGTFMFLQGAIESPYKVSTGYPYDAIGINMDDYTPSVRADCDFFNNQGGNWACNGVKNATNGKLGHRFHTPNSGEVFPPGTQTRYDTDANYMGHIRFMRNGVGGADIKLGVSAADSVAFMDSANAPHFSFNTLNNFFDVIENGYVRVRDGGYWRFFTSGTYTDFVSNSGSPEGNGHLCSPGSLCLNRQGGASKAMYVKATGSNTDTGWVVVPTQAAARANSSATDVANIKNDFNDLLEKLRTSGVLAKT
jgi:hypothetical protein